MAEIRHLENRHDVFFSAKGGPIWIKFRRLAQNDMSTAVLWWKSKPDVEFQYGGRSGEFNGMSSQSHVSHCRVLPLGEFTVTILESHATLQGVRIPPAILKIVFAIFYFIFVFNVVQALTSGGFRIVSDTLVNYSLQTLNNRFFTFRFSFFFRLQYDGNCYCNWAVFFWLPTKAY